MANKDKFRVIMKIVPAEEADKQNPRSKTYSIDEMHYMLVHSSEEDLKRVCEEDKGFVVKF